MSARPSSGVSPTGCFLGSWPAWARPCRGHLCQLLAFILLAGGQPPPWASQEGLGWQTPGGKCWRPRCAPCSAEALAGPSRNVQPERDGLVLLPPWSSGPCPRRCVWTTRAIETVCAQTCSPSADTRPVTSVFCSFLIKTLPRPCFPINLLVVSKYVRTPSLVKSGFE